MNLKLHIAWIEIKLRVRTHKRTTKLKLCRRIGCQILILKKKQNHFIN